MSASIGTVNSCSTSSGFGIKWVRSFKSPMYPTTGVTATPVRLLTSFQLHRNIPNISVLDAGIPSSSSISRNEVSMIVESTSVSTIPPGKHTCCLCVRTLLERFSNRIDATPFTLHSGITTLARLFGDCEDTWRGMWFRYRCISTKFFLLKPFDRPISMLLACLILMWFSFTYGCSILFNCSYFPASAKIAALWSIASLSRRARANAEWINERVVCMDWWLSECVSTWCSESIH